MAKSTHWNPGAFNKSLSVQTVTQADITEGRNTFTNSNKRPELIEYSKTAFFQKVLNSRNFKVVTSIRQTYYMEVPRIYCTN